MLFPLVSCQIACILSPENLLFPPRLPSPRRIQPRLAVTYQLFLPPPGVFLPVNLSKAHSAVLRQTTLAVSYLVDEFALLPVSIPDSWVLASVCGSELSQHPASCSELSENRQRPPVVLTCTSFAKTFFFKAQLRCPCVYPASSVSPVSDCFLLCSSRLFCFLPYGFVFVPLPAYSEAMLLLVGS